MNFKPPFYIYESKVSIAVCVSLGLKAKSDFGNLYAKLRSEGYFS